MIEDRNYWRDAAAKLRANRLSRRNWLKMAMTGAATAGGAGLAACSGRSAKMQQAAAGPGQSGSAETPQAGGIFKTTQSSNATLDPHRTAGNSTTSSLSPSLSRLFRYKVGLDPKVAENFDLENDLAASSESADALTWTVKLRSGANFHNIPPVNGHAVEAEDVKASFTRALGAKNPSHGALNMIDLNQIQTPASDTVVFKLNYPLASFPKVLASPTYSYILPREALSGAYDPAKVVIGSGPFIFESYEPDVAFTYKKNPAWFEKGLPYVDGVHAAIITDHAQLLAQFTAGNVDVTANGAVGLNDLQTMKQSNPKATLITSRNPSGGDYPLYFRHDDPASPFADIRVRQAISLAMDRATIGKVEYQDQAEQVYVVPTGFGKWALKQDELGSDVAQWYKFDLAQAKQLLSAAGASHLAAKFGYITNFAPFAGEYVSNANIKHNMLDALGIQSTMVPLDYFKDYIGGGKGARVGNRPSDMILLDGITTFSDVDEYLFNYFDSKSTTNHDHLKDPQLDSMIDKARTQVNEDARIKAYKDIQRYMAGKLLAIWGMPQGYNYNLVQPWIHNYRSGNSLSAGTETYAKLWIKK